MYVYVVLADGLVFELVKEGGEIYEARKTLK